MKRMHLRQFENETAVLCIDFLYVTAVCVTLYISVLYRSIAVSYCLTLCRIKIGRNYCIPYSEKRNRCNCFLYPMMLSVETVLPRDSLEKTCCLGLGLWLLSCSVPQWRLIKTEGQLPQTDRAHQHCCAKMFG